MKDFKVYYNGGWSDYPIESEVYAIDAQRDRFLIVDTDGYFKWVDTEDCKLSGFEE